MSEDSGNASVMQINSFSTCFLGFLMLSVRVEGVTEATRHEHIGLPQTHSEASKTSNKTFLAVKSNVTAVKDLPNTQESDTYEEGYPDDGSGKGSEAAEKKTKKKESDLKEKKAKLKVAKAKEKKEKTDVVEQHEEVKEEKEKTDVVEQHEE